MIFRPVRAALMTGVAVASLSTVAMADGWNSFIVFGDRNLDSGQYVSSTAVFAEEGDAIGDGRLRATNRVEGGGTGQTYPQLLSNALGLGSINPSQPQSIEGVPAPASGLNYAATFYRSADVLQSIIGTTRTSTVNYLSADGEATSVAGVRRAGLLNDPERRARAWGALVLIGGGARDLRETANITRDLDNTVDIYSSGIDLSAASVSNRAGTAANNIADGVDALTDAGAGLVVVVNSIDLGQIPEVGGDNGLLLEASTTLAVRETEAQTAEALALTAETIAENSAVITVQAGQTLQLRNDALQAAQADPASTPQEVAALTQQVATAQQVFDDSQAQTDLLTADALASRAASDAVALTAFEIGLRPELDAAIADPDLIGTTRTAASDSFNARLVQRLRSNDGNILLIDQRALFDAVIADPARFGLDAEVDQSNDCLDNSVLLPCNQVSGNDESLLFVNGLDLTTAGQQLAADQIEAFIKAPSAFAGVPRIGISAGRGISDVGRDQVSREQSWKPGFAPFATAGASRVKLSSGNGPGQQDAAFYSGVAGMKYIPLPGLAFGAGIGYQDVDSPGDNSDFEYEGSAFFGTAFAGINTGPLFGNITATYGQVNLDDLDRVSQIGSARIVNTGDTEATVLGFTAEAGMRLLQYDIVRAGPIANVSHWSSEVDGYRENGWQVTAVEFNDFEAKSTRAGIGLFMEAGNLVEGQGSLFRAKALYGYEFQDERERASVTPVGPNSVGSFSTDVRGADRAPLELGAEIVLGFGPVVTTIGYDGLFGDVSDHRFRIGASMPL